MKLVLIVTFGCALTKCDIASHLEFRRVSQACMVDFAIVLFDTPESISTPINHVLLPLRNTSDNSSYRIKWFGPISAIANQNIGTFLTEESVKIEKTISFWDLSTHMMDHGKTAIPSTRTLRIP